MYESIQSENEVLSAYSSSSETITTINDTTRHLFSMSKWRKGCREISMLLVMGNKHNTLDCRTIDEARITSTMISNRCLKSLVPFISMLRSDKHRDESLPSSPSNSVEADWQRRFVLFFLPLMLLMPLYTVLLQDQLQNSDNKQFSAIHLLCYFKKFLFKLLLLYLCVEVIGIYRSHFRVNWISVLMWAI